MSIEDKLSCWFNGENDMGITFDCNESDILRLVNYLNAVPVESVNSILKQMLTSVHYRKIQNPVNITCIPKLQFLPLVPNGENYMETYNKIEQENNLKPFTNICHSDFKNAGGGGKTLYISIVTLGPVKIVNFFPPVDL